MYIESIDRFRIILASRSPRRQHLMRSLGIKFDVLIRDFPETYPEELKGGEDIARHVAYEKAQSLKGEISGNEIFITADTIVWHNNHVLGKPRNMEEAKGMLKEISDSTHEVITGVCLLSKRYERLFSVSTKVTFDKLSDEEIQYYISNFKPYDKAGSYGIQEWIGFAACSHIEGSYFNVVGLPVHRLYRELQQFVFDQSPM